jgi:hypothetical protein
MATLIVLPWQSTPSTSSQPRWQTHVGLYSCTIPTDALLFFCLVFPTFCSYALSPVMAMMITSSCGGSSEVSPTFEAVRHCPDCLTRRQLLHVSNFVGKYSSITESCVCVAFMLHNWFFSFIHNSFWFPWFHACVRCCYWSSNEENYGVPFVIMGSIDEYLLVFWRNCL